MRFHQILLALAAALSLLGSLQAADKPNVLFIAVDDLRPELGCYGNKIVKTPNMDRLAARGIVFNRAYVRQAVCSPSRRSLLTGRRPDATKVWDLETHFRVALPDTITLPQHFKANGYHCSALSKIYHSGFEDGRSWNEPHWYPRGKSVDIDQVDWTKQIVTKHGVSVEEYSTTSAADGVKSAKRSNGKNARKGPAFEVSPKSDDELPDGATVAEAVNPPTAPSYGRRRSSRFRRIIHQVLAARPPVFADLTQGTKFLDFIREETRSSRHLTNVLPSEFRLAAQMRAILDVIWCCFGYPHTLHTARSS